MKSNDYILGAQDGFYIDKGSYTGQVSFYQLKNMGIKYSIIGHSEMKKMYDESDETVNKKIKSALKNDIIPIICVGETADEKYEGKTLDVIGKRLRDVLLDTNMNDVIIAYEPIWAIGSGMQPSRVEIEEVHMYIKKVLKDIYNIDSRVLYGGSVNIDNVSNIINIDGVDGVLIGSASVDPHNLIEIINKINM